MTVTEAVNRLDARGVYPSAGAIEKEMGRRIRHNLNGRDCHEREKRLVQLGYVRKTFEGGFTARWWKVA